MHSHATWFSQVTGFQPHDWQTQLAACDDCTDRLVRVPTGFGKTEGILGAWLWNAVDRKRSDWPRRLIWCLPMRVLVEQTASRARTMVDGWARTTRESARPRVHSLMGGEDTEPWYLDLESHAVLIGTQDMLLSRALNRGYGSARARWPMEYGLLNQDCLWVMDEVQLMDVGLATSAQLQAFREQDRSTQLRPCHTWWMSATLQPEWLRSVDTAAAYEQWVKTPCIIAPESRGGGLWEIPKVAATESIGAADTSAFAARIASEHIALGETQFGRITLVVCNTVERACLTHAALQDLGATGELELIHSRFRPTERAAWRERFLNREACTKGVDRIIVATQVVEAGVDISAGCLITELAPWPSLVQRFGRCARYGGQGRIVVVDRGREEKSTAPYDVDSLASAWEAIQSQRDLGLKSLEAFEDGLDNASRARLYPYQPAHLLMREEYEELFDTTPDLTGGDIDISRFIRSGDERDLHVFWTEIPNQKPEKTRQPHSDELCAVPFLTARNWLCGKESASNKNTRLRGGMRAWVWDWIDGQWATAQREMLVPGRIICVDSSCGGYLPPVGFSPDSCAPVPVVVLPNTRPEGELFERADNQQDGEPLSVSEWKTIAFHSSEVAEVVGELAARLGLTDQITRILTLAARWHDVGKSHPAFQGKIRDGAHESRPARYDLAKGPTDAWLQPPGRYVFLDNDSEERPAFRHELASALALFSVLRLYAPDHPALLGPWRDVLDTLGRPFPTPALTHAPDEIQAVLDCTGEELDLLVYLVASHHGKVRVALHAAPADQDYRPAPGDAHGLPIRGIRNGDCLPSFALVPEAAPLAEIPLTLDPAAMGLSFETGASWRERTQKLIRRHGPAALALLEAILRAADIRASQRKTADPAFVKEIST